MAQTRILQLHRRRIRRDGELLTVSRRPPAAGAAPTTQQVYFVPRALDAKEVPDLRVEGAANLAAMMAHAFCCAAGEDVREAVDDIIYQGFAYQVVQVTPRRKAGAEIELVCIATRERAI